jgi:hypothetical protein
MNVPPRNKAIIEGECCQGCTMYFVRGHGRKVWCRHCWERLSYKKRQSKRQHKATHPDLGD